MIYKNLMLHALGTIRIHFNKKVKNKCHACVPLSIQRKSARYIAGCRRFLRFEPLTVLSSSFIPSSPIAGSFDPEAFQLFSFQEGGPGKYKTVLPKG
jgi:hypothetical protein